MPVKRTLFLQKPGWDGRSGTRLLGSLGWGLGKADSFLTFPPSVPSARLCKRMSWSSSWKAFSVTTLVVSLTSLCSGT